MKILLLGRNGQVGHELRRTLLPLGELLAVSRSEVDLADLEGLKAKLRQYQPDLVVNAAAYTAVDKAEVEIASAFKVNAEAVAVMADYASANGARLVHYSTDYVFDGAKGEPYAETDVVSPQNVYGKSKCAGEDAIRASGCDAIILRTSWVISSHGKNFIKTILRLAQERDSLDVVADQIGAPTSAELIADVTALAVAAWFQHRLHAGTYHLTASGATSWHGLASYILERMHAQGVSTRLRASAVRAVSTDGYPLPAKRPLNSRMNTEAICGALGLTLPDWKNHVDRCVDQLLQLDSST